MCTNVPKCAQCHVIQQYRSDLKENVTKALEYGKLHRNDYINQEFPPLGESKKPQQSPWNRVQTETCNNDALDSTKALFLINENLVEMRESNKRVEGKREKIELKLNQTALDTEFHQTTVVKLIEHAK